LDGKEYPFVLDTGANMSFFDVSLRSHLGTRIGTERVQTAEDRVDVDSYPPRPLHIGTLTLTSEARSVCLDLAPMRQAFGNEIQGFLGIDFLKDWIVTIDFDEGRLDFLASDAAKNPQWGESIPFVFDSNGLIWLSATVGKNTRTSFMVDVGDAGTGSLHGELFSQLVGSRDLRITGDMDFMDLAGTHNLQKAWLSRLALESFQHQNLLLRKGHENRLGLGYLRRYRVTFDFPHQRLFLAKGKRFAEPDRGPMCGLSLLFKPGRIEIAAVDEKGPAHAAGVQAKDVIVAVAGKPVSTWKRTEIQHLLKSEGKTVQMTIERDGKRTDVSFTLREYE